MSQTSTRIIIQAEDKASGVARNVGNEFERLSQRIVSASGLAQKALGGLGMGGVGSAFYKSWSDAGEYRQLGLTLEHIGGMAGQSKGQLDALTLGLRALDMTGQQARQSLLSLAQAEIDLSKATDLVRISRDAAALSGKSEQQAYQGIIRAIQGGKQETVRALGLNASFTDSYRKMARELGVAQNQLTEAQKKQARLNEVLKSGEPVAGAYETRLSELRKSVASLQVSLGNLSTDFGKLLNNNTVGGIFSFFIDEFRQFAQELDVAALVSRGLFADLNFAELREASRGGLDSLRAFVERAEEMRDALPKADEEVKRLAADLDALDRLGASFSTAAYRTEIDRLSSLLESKAISAATYLKLIKELRTYLSAEKPGVVLQEGELRKTYEQEVEERISSLDSGLLKNSRKLRLERLNKTFDPEIQYLREATQTLAKGTAEHKKAQEALNALLAEKERQRAGIVGRGGGSGGKSTASYLDDLTAKVESLRGRLAEDRGDTFLASLNKDLAEAERRAEKLKGADKEQYLALIGEYKTLGGQYADKQREKDAEKSMQVRLDFEREYAELTGLTSEAVTRSLQRQYEEYRKAGVDIVQLEEWKRDKIIRASREAGDGAARALKDYALEATDAARNVEGFLTSGFSRSEDALVSFVSRGKLEFKSFVNSIIADLGRVAVRQNVTGPLVGALGGLLGQGLGSGWSASTLGNSHLWPGATYALNSAKGNVFPSGSDLDAYLNGIVNQPTAFRFAKGGVPRFGLMGEAGAEAIMPLTRTPSGDLGVRASGMAPQVEITIIDQRSGNAPPVEVRENRSPSGGVRYDILLLDAVDHGLADRIMRGTSRAGNAISKKNGTNPMRSSHFRN